MLLSTKLRPTRSSHPKKRDMYATSSGGRADHAHPARPSSLPVVIRGRTRGRDGEGETTDLVTHRGRKPIWSHTHYQTHRRTEQEDQNGTTKPHLVALAFLSTSPRLLLLSCSSFFFLSVSFVFHTLYCIWERERGRTNRHTWRTFFLSWPLCTGTLRE